MWGYSDKVKEHFFNPKMPVSKQLYVLEAGVNLQNFPALSEQVARASGDACGSRKSLIGKNVFSHEAGIHVDGLLKEPNNYQGVDPAVVGRSHQLVLGKHSGTEGGYTCLPTNRHTGYSNTGTSFINLDQTLCQRYQTIAKAVDLNRFHQNLKSRCLCMKIAKNR